MITPSNYLKALIGFCWILLHVTNISCNELEKSVVRIYSKGEYYLCAGTLVADNFVLTSGTCLDWHRNASLITVVGKSPKHSSAVVEIIIPKDFDKKTRYMDVAMLKLKDSIPEAESAKLCTKSSINAGEALIVNYWHLENDHYKYEPLNSEYLSLQNRDMSVTSHEICAKGYKEKYVETMFCGVNPDRIDCYYDKGGPADVDGEVCGINNFDHVCTEEQAPGSFTSLANPKVMAFITETLKK